MKISSVFSAKRDYRKSYPVRLVSKVKTSVSAKTIEPFSSTHWNVDKCLQTLYLK